MKFDEVPIEIRSTYQILETHHAATILRYDFPEEWADIIDVLMSLEFNCDDVANKGHGNKSIIANRIDKALVERGWQETEFATEVQSTELSIIGTTRSPRKSHRRENPSHAIDCYKNRVALETEWNTKNTFFDRDLSNFRILFELGHISVGVIITRCDELDCLFKALGKTTAAGPATTRMSQVQSKVAGGGAGGCPVLVVGVSLKRFSGIREHPRLDVECRHDLGSGVLSFNGNVPADVPFFWSCSRATGTVRLKTGKDSEGCRRSGVRINRLGGSLDVLGIRLNYANGVPIDLTWSTPHPFSEEKATFDIDIYPCCPGLVYDQATEALFVPSHSGQRCWTFCDGHRVANVRSLCKGRNPRVRDVSVNVLVGEMRISSIVLERFGSYQPDEPLGVLSGQTQTVTVAKGGRP